MNERVKEIRKSLNMNQGELAELLKLKQGSLSDFERGRCNFSTSTIALLCEKLNINEEWLITGEGEMFKPPKEGKDLLLNENPQLAKLFIMYNSLPDDKKDLANSIIENLVKLTNQTS